MTVEKCKDVAQSFGLEVDILALMDKLATSTTKLRFCCYRQVEVLSKGRIPKGLTKAVLYDELND